MWEPVRIGEKNSVWRLPDGTCVDSLHPRPAGVLSGSFNPLHEGHRDLRNAAERRLGGFVCYELTITNADKPPLDSATIEARCRQFEDHPLWVTNAPTFVRKAELLPGVVFVVGADTAQRIVQPRFYRDDKSEMAAALDHIRRADCRFLVAGRLWEGEFQTRKEIDIPQKYLDLFETLPESEFRRDISSTELREES